jgi:hypothetical protein
MTVYKQKTPTINAVRLDPAALADGQDLVSLDWLTDRDHLPDDLDPDCGRSWAQHVWIGTETDGRLTCPGDYVITSNEGEIYSQSRAEFESRWEAS